MKVIIQFENHGNVALRFQNEVLSPELRGAGVRIEDVRYCFQNYRDRSRSGAPILPPRTVAEQICRIIEALERPIEKYVWMLDLDPTGSDSPDSSYGLCVLLSLSEQFGVSVEEFLSNRDFLTVILTLFPAGLQKDDGIRDLIAPSCDLKSLDAIWRRVRRIHRGIGVKRDEVEVERAVSDALQDGARLVMANGGVDERWVGRVIARWIKEKS